MLNNIVKEIFKYTCYPLDAENCLKDVTASIIIGAMIIEELRGINKRLSRLESQKEG